jgi:hypothetical protein
MTLFGMDRQPKLRLPYFDGSAAPRAGGFSYFRQPLKSADAHAAPTDEYAMIESGRVPSSTGRTHTMKARDFIVAGLAGLILAAHPFSAIKAAPLSGAREAGGTNVIWIAHRHGRRPSARLACADMPANWPYYFHEFYCPDGHPLPVGFYGGKAFYFGGVW